MRIIFMGSPEFAVESLRTLQQAGCDIAGVVTAPDQPAGRGMQLRPSAVKVYAEAAGLPLLQPVKLRDPAFLSALEALRPDLIAVVAFRMLPKVVWSLPRLGSFNLHASLLPDYRGAAPINWAIINGETRTGVTTFLLDEAIDTGSILLQRETPILPDWDAGALHDRLMALGAELVLETVRGLESGSLSPQPQRAESALHAAPKLFKEDGQLDWSQPALAVHNRIRGLSPYPGAWTMLDGKMFKVLRAQPLAAQGLVSGRLHSEGQALYAPCAEGALELLDVQLEGKRKMSGAEFLRGYKGPLLLSPLQP